MRNPCHLPGAPYKIILHSVLITVGRGGGPGPQTVCSSSDVPRLVCRTTCLDASKPPTPEPGYSATLLSLGTVTDSQESPKFKFTGMDLASAPACAHQSCPSLAHGGGAPNHSSFVTTWPQGMWPLSPAMCPNLPCSLWDPVLGFLQAKCVM